MTNMNKLIITLTTLLQLLSINVYASESTDQKQGQAFCISGFAEATTPWDSDFFLSECARVKTAAEGKCIEGFASSTRRWNSASDFLRACKRVQSMSEATCIYGFARSDRSWSSSFFFDECEKLR